MYLCDRDIRAILAEINIETDNAAHPFVSDDQIQPCSIDLRLSDVFWMPNKRATIDLRKSSMLETAPRRQWRRITLKAGECLTLKPGQFLLGRTYEKFTIPETTAGGIEGRSSFARMGLSIHCEGGFINPGYCGHMPLQLVNQGHHTIKIFPFISVCQLKLVKLTGVPDRSYGTDVLQSKYMDDDGGPSFWWRDKRISVLQEKLRTNNLALSVQSEIFRVIGNQEPEVFERFENFVDRMTTVDLENSDVILNAFANSEDKRRKLKLAVKWMLPLLFTLLGAYAVRLIFEHPHKPFHWVIWILAILSAVPSYLGAVMQLGDCFGNKELNKFRFNLKGDQT